MGQTALCLKGDTRDRVFAQAEVALLPSLTQQGHIPVIGACTVGAERAGSATLVPANPSQALPLVFRREEGTKPGDGRHAFILPGRGRPLGLRGG